MKYYFVADPYEKNPKYLMAFRKKRDALIWRERKINVVVRRKKKYEYVIFKLKITR